MIVLSTFSCGIDTINYLSEDPLPISSDSSSFIFSIRNTVVNPYYLGVMIFYRIYASEVDAESDKAYVSAKQSEANSVPGSLIENQLISSSGLGYNSLVVNDEIRIPVISKNDVNDDDDYINVSFTSTIEQPNYYIEHASATLYTLKRNVINPGGYKTFLDKPVAGDPDYRSRIDDIDSTYYIQFYGAAYGLDGISFEDLYGKAIYLGRMTVYYF
jgi:hypothetical protein